MYLFLLHIYIHLRIFVLELPLSERDYCIMLSEGEGVFFPPAVCGSWKDLVMNFSI